MQSLLRMSRCFTITICMSVRPHASTLAFLDGCGGPWWDMLRRPFSVLEDILRTHYKRILSAITHKLNVPEHMLIWTLFLTLVCATCAQSFPAPFSTPCRYRYVHMHAAMLISRDRTVSITTSYRLPARDVSLLHTFQTDCRTQPPVHTRDSFPGSNVSGPWSWLLAFILYLYFNFHTFLLATKV
jgi:hypothetical protein